LRASGEEVQLTVSDAGAGFDVEKARNERGLGLVSMQERVHLVHGRFQIESAPGAGTRIVAVVPLLAADEAASTEAERSGGAATGAA
jgi:signal transduction histidine kinase